MYYDIQGLRPRMQEGRIDMSGWGFNIVLYPEFKQIVSNSRLDQKDINNAVNNMGRSWLDGCGFDNMYDPDNYGIQTNHNLPPGPNAHRLYEPNRALTVRWGEWGPEHISVPGNACGLDIDREMSDGSTHLYPHNVDSMHQAMLLLTVFCWFAETLTMDFHKGI